MKVKSESEFAESCATPWTAAYQAPPPMGFSRQEYWSGVPLPSLSKVTGYKIKTQKSLAFVILTMKHQLVKVKLRNLFYHGNNKNYIPKNKST